MMKRDDATLWLRQAADDYRFGRAAVAGKFHAQACFIAQQVGEKAVEAVHYQFARTPVIGHSVRALLKRLNARAGVTAELLELAGLTAGQRLQYRQDELVDARRAVVVVVELVAADRCLPGEREVYAAEQLVDAHRRR